MAESILHGGDLVDLFKDYARPIPRPATAAHSTDGPSRRPRALQSWGNGSAMRVSPVGFAYRLARRGPVRAKWTAEVTHDHPEGIKGAQATAAAVFLARTGSDKEQIRDYVERKFGYRPEHADRRDPPRFRLRRLLPGDRAAGDPGVPRVERLRERRPAGGLAGRRRRHAGLHRGRDRPGVYRRRPRRSASRPWPGSTTACEGSSRSSRARFP